MSDKLMKIWGVVLFSLCFSISISNAEPVSGIEATSLELVGKKRSSRTTLDYTYKATFVNNGLDVSNVTATVSSSSTNVKVLEGVVVVGDLVSNTPTTSDDTFTISIDRTVPFNRDVLSWGFDAVNTIAIDVGPTEIILDEGESVNQSYTVSFVATDATSKKVIFNQQVSPSGGIQVTDDAPNSWESSSTNDWVVNGTLSALSAGQYTVTTTATIVETGDVVTEDILVTVKQANQLEYNLNAPIMFPGGIQSNQTESVFFSAQLDIENNAPGSLELEETDSNGTFIATVGMLLDNGQDGDVTENDGIYSGTFLISSNVEGKKYYRVSFVDIGHSSVTSLAIVDFPTTTAIPNPDALIETDDPLVKVYADHIIVSFKEKILSSIIKHVVNEVGGEIIGSIAGFAIIQVGFEQKTLPELELLIDAYNAREEVEFAELSGQEDVDAVFPNDSGSSNNMQVSRVDEIRLIAPKGGSIAIVDTGVDYNHSDLTNVKRGKDLVSSDDDPMDVNGHGTHVAGIAGAIINNGQGVAGVADTDLIAIRGIGAIAKSITYAATRSKVINISGGSYSNSRVYERVTKKLGGKVIVAAAHNDGLDRRRYPCANTNVLCVGNSTDSDDRASSSNYGSWVDIAAPGQNVLSTKLGGGTTTMSGTSMSSPLVAGVARIIWNQHPNWDASEVKQRLLDTAFAAPGLEGQEIGKRVDAFEAFFNGDFELDLKEWAYEGTCSTKTKLGPILPKSGKKMAFCTTGPADNQVAATLIKELNFVADSDFTIKFWYNFVSEEYPEYVDSMFDDNLKIKLVAPDGTETILAQESINSSNFEAVSGIDFPGGDSTVGQLKGGWKEVNKTVSVKKGSGSYKIVIEDAGDDIFDTAVLLDNIRLK